MKNIWHSMVSMPSIEEDLQSCEDKLRVICQTSSKIKELESKVDQFNELVSFWQRRQTELKELQTQWDLLSKAQRLSSLTTTLEELESQDILDQDELVTQMDNMVGYLKNQLATLHLHLTSQRATLKAVQVQEAPESEFIL